MSLLRLRFDVTFDVFDRRGGRRIPAGNWEGLVINRLRTFLADPGAILDAVDNDSHNG
jgi:hypothetical protein